MTLATDGKGLSEMGLDVATGKDCRFLEGALREDREICEIPGSPANRMDFKGVSTMMQMLEGDGPAPGAWTVAAQTPPAREDKGSSVSEQRTGDRKRRRPVPSHNPK